MSTTINGFEPPQPEGIKKPKGGKAFDASSTAVGNTSATPAQVEVDSAKLSKQVDELNSPQAPFDAQKVAELKEKIEKGEFFVKPENVAQAILDEARDLVFSGK